jgi:hypothetical protein
MGRSVTPKYRVETKENVGAMTPAAWRGRATPARLAEWVEACNKSFLPGGVNGHVSESRGVVVYIHAAKIIEQATGRVVAEYKAPAFQVF